MHFDFFTSRLFPSTQPGVGIVKIYPLNFSFDVEFGYLISGNKPATCAYDIYCFGKVLLGLVTGNVGISVSDCEAAMDEDWLQQLLPYINLNDRELVGNIVDPHLVLDEDLLDKVWAMAIVAKSCLDPDPSRRPSMRDVLKALHNPLEVVREAETFSSRELYDRRLSLLRYLSVLPFPIITFISLFFILFFIHKIKCYC